MCSAAAGEPIPIAPLRSIDLGLLEHNDENECKRLLHAAEEQGFFYLDLSSKADLVRDWQIVLEFMEKYFSQSQDKKMAEDRKSDTHR
jgi:isopenicillin N synthase-like dioxygenase